MADKTKRKTILVADSDKETRQLLKNFFIVKYNVVLRQDGRDTLSWIQGGNFPDFLLMNIDLPIINGFEIVKNIRSSEYFKRIPVILFSEKECAVNKMMALKTGADDFISKPLGLEEIAIRIENVFQRIDDYYKSGCEKSVFN